jgi:hypothetical protein
MSLLALGTAGGRAAWTVQDGDRTFAVFMVGERCYVTDAKCQQHLAASAQITRPVPGSAQRVPAAEDAHRVGLAVSSCSRASCSATSISMSSWPPT